AGGLAGGAGVRRGARLPAPAGPDGGGGGGTGPVLAAAPSPSSALARVNGLAPAPAAAPRLQADGNLLRDPRVDEYLRAHQAARGGIPMAVPGGGLRRVDAEMQPGPSR
ncbi:MAG: hypothetical protein LH480_15570, partial [Rubrivivax sp.]|nr:hypothetical protein [Rubrivivax sp.]